MRRTSALLLLLAACSRDADQPANDPISVHEAANEAVASAAPSAPGDLPDDRAAIVEDAIDPKSPQGAAQVLQHYFALAEQGRFSDAYRLWSDSGRATGESEADFVAGFRQYREFHAEIGAPGGQEGAAGSSYVSVPVQVYGRMADGKAFKALGTMTLRRVNDVPGATSEQLQWRIYKSELKPSS
jgi:hypothetical protein